ncbi:hypothetical protein AMR72_17485 [Flavobacterium psychrophilum]|nr:hypothetical protein AMR72_17485 [Flavobacterium psychrophilum]AOE54141.1 hypothetical protein ALW18_17475 [Flavobacterium psychrophilum]
MASKDIWIYCYALPDNWLKKQSKAYLEKVLEAIGKVDDIHIVNQYKAMVYQELALYKIEDKIYHK